MVALLVGAPTARAADPVDHSKPSRPGRHAGLRGVGSRPVHGRARLPHLGQLAPAARPAIRLRVRPRARLETRVHSGISAERGCLAFGLVSDYAGKLRGARRVQGLRGQRGPQGARVDDRPPPGGPAHRGAAACASTRSRPGCSASAAVECWRELARWPTSARPWPTAPGVESRDSLVPPAGARLQPLLRGVGHGTRRGRRVPGAPELRHRAQRDHPVRPRRPGARGLQQASGLW